VEQDLLIKIGQAFGNHDECLGILAVADVPGLEPMRHRLLPLARDLAMLPKEELDAITDETSGYQVGWSHGKEKVEGDKLDLAKGSFYANPLTDNLLESRPDTDPKVARDNPAFFAPNIWPTSSLPDFENAFKELGTLVCDIGRLLARLCDAYVRSKVSCMPYYYTGW
jgi:isopenicillin N synthase-like dioxygenase